MAGMSNQQALDSINTTLPFLRADHFPIPANMFSAAWWQTFDRFREVPLNNVKNNVGVVFSSMRLNNFRGVRLPVDWMDFSVEHLSKWYKTTEYDKWNTGYQRLVHNLLVYLEQSLDMGNAQLDDNDDSAVNPWRATLTVVAYAPIRSDYAPERARRLDATILAALLASLIRQKCGRIVVATNRIYLNYTSTEIWPTTLGLLEAATRTTPMISETNASKSFSSWEAAWERVESDNQKKKRGLNSEPSKVASTELALVGLEVPIENDSIPRQLLKELQEALFATPQTERLWQRRATYLGNESQHANKLKYLYFTEQDSPVQPRTRTFADFTQLLDSGGLLIPHRWQPVPHSSDLEKGETSPPGNNDTNALPPYYYLPAVGNWSAVTTLTDETSCCDLGCASQVTTRDYAVVPHGYWFDWGLGVFLKEIQENNPNTTLVQAVERMSQYQLVRLAKGTQIALLAASNQARQCRPTARKGACPIPPSVTRRQVSRLLNM
jgi:hypothetical protein